MDKTTTIALVSALTIIVNLIFALSGVTTTLSCTVSDVGANVYYSLFNH